MRYLIRYENCGGGKLSKHFSHYSPELWQELLVILKVPEKCLLWKQIDEWDCSLDEAANLVSCFRFIYWKRKT